MFPTLQGKMLSIRLLEHHMLEHHIIVLHVTNGDATLQHMIQNWIAPQTYRPPRRRRTIAISNQTTYKSEKNKRTNQDEECSLSGCCNQKGYDHPPVAFLRRSDAVYLINAIATDAIRSCDNKVTSFPGDCNVTGYKSVLSWDFTPFVLLPSAFPIAQHRWPLPQCPYQPLYIS
jgi:hypothetical protein